MISQLKAYWLSDLRRRKQVLKSQLTLQIFLLITLMLGEPSQESLALIFKELKRWRRIL